jgi:hypothetical protein
VGRGEAVGWAGGGWRVVGRGGTEFDSRPWEVWDSAPQVVLKLPHSSATNTRPPLSHKNISKLIAFPFLDVLLNQ